VWSPGIVFKLTPPIPPAKLWTESNLHTFIGGTDGTQAMDLVMRDGALYGTTSSGGSLGFGAVFELTPPNPPASQWTKSEVHAFSAAGFGAYPSPGLIFDSAGALYGTTVQAGASIGCPASGNCGVVFKLTPPAPSANSWRETVLHIFTSVGGSIPWSGVIFGPAGELYGTTVNGGRFGKGVVYRLQ
jgi:uncharacterized repeat protein (TIGR03803 family)